MNTASTSPLYKIKKYSTTDHVGVMLRVYVSKELELLCVEKVLWKNVKELISELCKKEHENMLCENKRIKELENRKKKEETNEEKLDRVVLLYRGKEKYINVLEKGWEKRYKEVSKSDMESYVRMLTWCVEYYDEKEVSKKARYEGENAPLLSEIYEKCRELSEKKPIWENTDISQEQPISEEAQLKYICPNESEFPKDIKMNWLFKEYYREIQIVPDLSFRG